MRVNAPVLAQGEVVTGLSVRARAVLPGLNGRGQSLLSGVRPAVDTGVFLARSVRWVHTNLDSFAPPHGSWSVGSVGNGLGNLLDLAIVCRTARGQHLPTPVARLIETCLDRIAEIFHHRSFHDALIRSAPLFLRYLWLLAVLRDVDRLADPLEHAAAQRMVDFGYGDLLAAARSAQETLEASYILRIAGLQAPGVPALGDLYPRCALAWPLDPVYVTEKDAYQVTHMILFLSDMGSHPVLDLTFAERTRAEDEIEELLGLYVAAGHWDLTAELLLCRLALSRPDSRLAGLARTSLLAAQLPDGVVPGSGFDAELSAGLGARERALYVFTRCRHTTLAAVLYMAILCGSDDVPRSRGG